MRGGKSVRVNPIFLGLWSAIIQIVGAPGRRLRRQGESTFNESYALKSPVDTELPSDCETLTQRLTWSNYVAIDRSCAQGPGDTGRPRQEFRQSLCPAPEDHPL